MNRAKLTIGESVLSGWSSVSVSRSIDSLAGSVDISMVDKWLLEEMPIAPDIACRVEIDDARVLTGYIDSVSLNTTATGNRMGMAGRCKTGNLVDCSIISNVSTWANVDIVRLATELCDPFGIKVINRLSSVGTKSKSVTLNDGESPFEIIDRLCKERAILCLSDTNGDLVLTNAGEERANDRLEEGVNVLSADVSYEFTNRFARYIVKGQDNTQGDGWNSGTVKQAGESFDEGVTRYRPKILTADNAITVATLKKRAAWEAQTRAGRSIKVALKVVGWTQSNGDLWRENLLVFCKIPSLRVDSDMLINQVDYSQQESGTICSLQLVRPDTYAAEPPKEVKSKKKKKSWSLW